MEEEKADSKVSPEVLKELRNDFTFFVASSMLKTVALDSPDPKAFIRDVVWKWRELQVNALGHIVNDMEKKMSTDDEFNELFGDLVKKASRAQREVIIGSVRAFCDGIEKLLTSGIDEAAENREEDEFAG